MTREELEMVLDRVMPEMNELLKKVRVPLPNRLVEAAVQLFLRKDVVSNDADIVRQQLMFLNENGKLDCGVSMRVLDGT